MLKKISFLKDFKFFFIFTFILVALLNTVIINITSSVPFGVYLHLHSNSALKVNDYIAFKPEGALAQYSYSNKYLMPGMLYIKLIGAMEGDEYYIKDNIFYINNKAIGPLKASDSLGNKLPQEIKKNTKYIVKKGNVLLITNHPLSFDSRYYGEVSIKSVKKIYPLITLKRP